MKVCEIQRLIEVPEIATSNDHCPYTRPTRSLHVVILKCIINNFVQKTILS